MSKFKDSVVGVVNKVPRGNVVSYGQVALYIGSPRSARQVGWVLSGMDEPGVPWWRVVNKDGLITINNSRLHGSNFLTPSKESSFARGVIKGSKFDKNEQRRLLQSEGVVVNENYELDMDKYCYVPDNKFIASLELEEEYLNYLTDKFGV